jgi:hypothetical protein
MVNTIKKYLPEPFASEYIAHYRIESSMTSEEVSPCVEAALTDCTFTSLPYFMAKSNPEQSYAYHFNQLSSLENPWKGTAHHSLDYMCEFHDSRADV